MRFGTHQPNCGLALKLAPQSKHIIAVALGVILAIIGPTKAAADEPAVPSPNIRDRITRLANIDWALTSAVSGACEDAFSGFQLTLDSLDAYPEGDRAKLAAAWGWSVLPHVLFAPSEGFHGERPKYGDEILAINGQHILDAISDIEGVSTAHRVESLLLSQPLNSTMEISVRRKDEQFDLRLTPIPICQHNAVVVPSSSRKAYSDRHGLAVTTGLMDYVRNDDELALLVAHEFAHILLYDHFKRTKPGSKRKEDAVDALGARIAGCAGYNVGRGIEFWNDLDKTRPLSFIPSLSHRKSKTRYRDLQKVIANLNCETLVSDIRAKRGE